MGSLQEQLLKAGLVNKEQAETKQDPSGSGRQVKKPRRQQRASGARQSRKYERAAAKPGNKPGRRKQRQGDDLKAAWRARAKAEQQEREQEKQRRVQEQEQRRRRNDRLAELVAGKLQYQDDNADIPRYFHYMGKIRRMLLTPEQLEQVNNGELGIAVLRSRPILLDPETLEQFRAIAPDLVPDLGGDQPTGEQWDEQYQGYEVPDDLRW